MKKIIKNILYIAIVLVIIFMQYKFLGKYELKNDLLSSIVTWLSIIFGFYITSLAIFTTSGYVSQLYEIDDGENKGQTLLHTLINKFKLGLYLIIFSLIYLLIVIFLINQLNDNKLLLSDWRLIPFLAIITLNFVISIELVGILIKIIIQEGKIKK